MKTFQTLFWTCWVTGVASVLPAAPPAAFEPFFQQHCYECHDSDVKKGDLDLTALGSDMSDRRVMSLWVRIHDRVRDDEMPPPKRERPEADETEVFLSLLAGGLTLEHAKFKGTVLRRLNRTEYENTLNDMLGVNEELAGLLPEDGKGVLFNNVAEKLDMSPVHLARYMDAAQLALNAATRRTTEIPNKIITCHLGEGNDSGNVGKAWQKRQSDGAIVTFQNGISFPVPMTRTFSAQMDGLYRIKVKADAHRSETPLTLTIASAAYSRNGAASRRHATFDVPLGDPVVVETEAYLRRDEFIQILPDGLKNSWTDIFRRGGKESTAADFEGPGLAIHEIVIEGPILDGWPGRGHELMFGDLTAANPLPPDQLHRATSKIAPIASENAEADIARLLPQFIHTAFRRAATPMDINFFMGLAHAELAKGSKFEDAMRTAQVAVLCSPEFLFFQEWQPGALDDFAVASRLSYFLWRSLPDRELLSLAARKKLRDPTTLREQVARLLADTKSQRFVQDFTSQWLNLYQIDDTTPDGELYPEFDPNLQEAMVAETRMFFDDVLHSNLPVGQLVDSDWTYVNQRLAKHYGIEGVKGSGLRKVELKPDHHRGGVMTHASVLKVSANGATTSPVIRGIWVLERLLGVEPPPPPPGVPGIEPDVRGATTLREMLEKHREMASCKGCHQLIDPPGFALENFDVIGGWRDHYRALGDQFPKPDPTQTDGRAVRWRVGPVVDAAGETRNGEAFTNWQEFKKLILADPDRFAGAFTKKLATFATGREMGFSDRETVQNIVSKTAAQGHRLQDLIEEIVTSPIFLEK